MQNHPGWSGEPNEKLMSAVSARLEKHPRIHQKRIRVEVRGQVAILTGTAEDRYERRRAEEIAGDVEGVAMVMNRVVIQREG